MTKQEKIDMVGRIYNCALEANFHAEKAAKVALEAVQFAKVLIADLKKEPK